MKDKGVLLHYTHEGRGHLPGAGTNHLRGGGIYLQQDPMPRGEGIATISDYCNYPRHI